MIINGQKIATGILRRIKKEVNILRRRRKHLKLACVLVGRDRASLSFIRRKEKSCREVGIDFRLCQMPKSVKQETLIRKIKKIQEEKNLSGFILQLPLPKRLNQPEVIKAIRPDLDIDCLTPENLGKLAIGAPVFLPPTASAILHLLKIYKIRFLKRHIVVVGRGDLVGKPLAILLIQEKNTVTSCTKYTKNLGAIVRQADILITAAGVPNLIKGEMVKTGAVVLDAGTSYYRGHICGDVKFEEVKKKVRLISPVPGGVGPVMVAKLLENALYSEIGTP